MFIKEKIHVKYPDPINHNCLRSKRIKALENFIFLFLAISVPASDQNDISV